MQGLRWWLGLVLGVLGLLLAGCSREPLAPPEVMGELVVAMRISPATYYIDPAGEAVGLDHDLVQRFAAQHGWTVRIRTVESLNELFDLLDHGEVHIAAAGLTATEERGRKYRFGPGYAEVKEQVICRKGRDMPKRPKDLIGLRIEVVADSSHAEALWWLRVRQLRLDWSEIEAAGEDELLERVQSGLSDCTVADSTGFEIARHYYPDLAVAFDLGKPQKVAWMLPRASDDSFVRKVEQFFAEMRKSGALERSKERYFGHVARLGDADILGILQRRETLLDPLRPHFYAAQMETGLDWRFLAALAYQESQWNPNATSPTGVRGLMMLTAQTADHLGVKNRLDPRESILGGARYVVMLKEALPERIPEPDRTWLALAAYNIGQGHLEDARRLAQSLGKNPDSWNDMKEVLPLISRAAYQDQLKYGFARGGEARALAENVRIYYDMLVRYEPPYRYQIGYD